MRIKVIIRFLFLVMGGVVAFATLVVPRRVLSLISENVRIVRKNKYNIKYELFSELAWRRFESYEKG